MSRDVHRLNEIVVYQLLSVEDDFKGRLSIYLSSFACGKEGYIKIKAITRDR